MTEVKKSRLTSILSPRRAEADRSKRLFMSPRFSELGRLSSGEEERGG
jgi:hypothetical protein